MSAARVSALALALCLSSTALASAQDAEEASGDLAEGVYARVIVDRVELRNGPGGSYQRVRVAERGDVFRVVQRATRGYWFRVELPDGTFGWVPGDTVYNHQVSREQASGGRFLPEIFAPPPLPTASGELAIGFGILGFQRPNGLMTVRPSVLIAPELALEANLAGAVGDGGRLFLLSGGPLINIFPTSPVVPFFTIGGGMLISDPNADTFLLESGMLGALYGGGGLRFNFRHRITLRIEARGYAFFDENRVVAIEEVSGGLTVYF